MFWLLLAMLLTIFLSWCIARFFAIRLQRRNKDRKTHIYVTSDSTSLGLKLDCAYARGNIKIPQGLCFGTKELDKKMAEEDRKGWKTC